MPGYVSIKSVFVVVIQFQYEAISKVVSFLHQMLTYFWMLNNIYIKVFRGALTSDTKR